MDTPRSERHYTHKHQGVSQPFPTMALLVKPGAYTVNNLWLHAPEDVYLINNFIAKQRQLARSAA